MDAYNIIKPSGLYNKVIFTQHYTDTIITIQKKTFTILLKQDTFYTRCKLELLTLTPEIMRKLTFQGQTKHIIDLARMFTLGRPFKLRYNYDN